MSNIGRKVKIINGYNAGTTIYNTMDIVGKVAKVVGQSNIILAIELEDGTKRKVYEPGYKNECEWYNEPTSYVGKRVRLSAEYMKDNPGYGEYGTVTDDDKCNIKGVWIVKMDNGINSVPYAPGSIYAQCTLLSEQDVVPDARYTIEAIKGKRIAVHCPTRQEWDEVTKLLGYIWEQENFWEQYEQESCINTVWAGYGTADLAYKDYEIISAQTFLTANNIKTMTTTEKKIKELEDQLNELKESLKVPQYKVGDWVVVTSAKSYSGNKIGEVKKITSTKIGNLCGKKQQIFNLHPEAEDCSYWECAETIRPATPEEVVKASKVKVIIGDAGKEVTIEKGKITAHDGTTVEKAQIDSLITMMAQKKLKQWDVKFHTVDVGCVKNITLAQLQKVQEEYKHLNP